MITEVTPDIFTLRYRETLLRGNGRILMVEQDEDSANFYHAVLFDFKGKNGVKKKEMDNLTKEEMKDLLDKHPGAEQYMVVDYVDRYLLRYNDDTEDTRTFQSICANLVHEHKDLERVKAHLAELVGFYRLSERSGLSLAEMVMDAESNDPYIAEP